MKIILCTDLFPLGEREQDGVTAAIKDLVLDSEKYGIELVCVVRFYVVISKRGFTVKPTCQRVGRMKIYNVPVVGYRQYFIRFLSSWLVRRILSEEKFDLVISHMAINFYRMQRCKSNFEFQHHLVVHKGDLASDLLSWCCKKANKVFFRSIQIQQQVLAKVSSTKTNGIVFSGVKSDFLQGRTPNINFNIDGSLKLVYCGVLRSIKNVDVVIRAAASLKALGVAVELNIVGGGPSARDLMKLVVDEKMEDDVFFHGWRDQNYIINVLDGSDIFVMPSKPETFGLAYLEAMARRCVVIGHSGEGIDGVVKDGYNGYLVSDATVEEIVAKIRDYIWLSEEARQLMHARIEQTISDYTSDAAAKNYASLITAKV